MSLFGSRESESSGRQCYCRKEKSLGVLCSNFLKLYNRDGVETIGLDDAATQLGVERRRIYDVVNILESVGVVARKAKNQYSWKGFGAIPQALELLKEEGLRENFSISCCYNSAKMSNENDNGGSSIVNTDGQDSSSAASKIDNKREKSLWLLTQNFVKLFLCSDVDMITLDSAAMTLLGETHNSTAMRTKIRRLYDIANVFSSINLIEKTHQPESRKPAFRWLGWQGKPKNESTTALDLNKSKKRMFGTDITNYSLKRNKEDFSINSMVNMPTHMKHKDLEFNYNENKSEQHLKQGSKDFVFGPFAPVSVARIDDSENKNVRKIPDLESLASTYRPQYRNQALSDLFDHYVEAWKSWYVEVAGKEQIQQKS